jgi:site-specific recombinase XerD
MQGADVTPQAFGRYMSRLRSESTSIKYVFAATQFLRVLHENGFNDFEKLPRGILNRYVEHLVARGQSPATVHVYLSGVRRYLKWVEDQGVKVAPLGTADKPKITHTMRDALSSNQIRLYFDQANRLEEPVRTAIMLLPCTGLRAQEMVNLPLAAIKRVELVMGGVVKRTLALRVRGKGGKERVVPVLDEGVALLTGYLAGYRRTRKGPWVFPGVRAKTNRDDRQSMSTRTLRAAVTQVREPLKLTFTPHTMRRTYATALYRRGVEPATIAKILGHANIQTLYKHYLALDEDDLIRAVHEV